MLGDLAGRALDVNLTGGERGEEDERQQAARQNFFSTKNSVTPAAAAVPAMAYITFARRASEVASEAWALAVPSSLSWIADSACRADKPK